MKGTSGGMSMGLRLITVAGIVLTFLVGTAFPCSRVFWNTNGQAKVTGRTMDLYSSDEPQLVVYPAGIERDGQAGPNSAKWKSKYGSVVVTSLGAATSDGMNEHGLAAHALYLDKTVYEPRDKRPGVSNGRWVQYLLDNFRTVNEALTGLPGVQIVSVDIAGTKWPLHVAFEDAAGDSAVIEYADGKAVIHHGPQYSVMTNEPFLDEQLINLKRYKLFGGDLALPGDIDPASRFVRASTYLKTLPEPKNEVEAIAGVASVIRSVMVPFGAIDTTGTELFDTWPTLWETFADLTHLAYYFSATTNPYIIWVELKNFNLKAGAPVLALDPRDPALLGDISNQLKPTLK